MDINPSFTSTDVIKTKKNKKTVILLALFLGVFGAHRFYLRQYWKGILSVIFCWTYIPVTISFIDIIIFGMMSEDKFDTKYNNTVSEENNPEEEQEQEENSNSEEENNPEEKQEEENDSNEENDSDDSTKKKNNNSHRTKANKNESLEDVVDELNSLIGLNDVKEEINTMINFVKIQKTREESGLKSSPLSYHIVFTGNPGTGKTTVARIVAKIYKHLGILTEGHLIETDRSGLIGEYLGQTAPKVNEVVDSALNGVLFIDEAYALVAEYYDSFGEEAVATLIKRMEDDRDQLVLIIAGYTNEMEKFLDTNPGLQSRFNRYINFPDYTPKELFEIFESNCKKQEYQLTEEAETKLKETFKKAYKDRDNSFGNGRFARNIFEQTLENQSNRIAQESNLTQEVLTTITVDDIE